MRVSGFFRHLLLWGKAYSTVCTCTLQTKRASGVIMCEAFVFVGEGCGTAWAARTREAIGKHYQMYGINANGGRGGREGFVGAQKEMRKNHFNSTMWDFHKVVRVRERKERKLRESRRRALRCEGVWIKTSAVCGEEWLILVSVTSLFREGGLLHHESHQTTVVVFYLLLKHRECRSVAACCMSWTPYNLIEG